MLGIVIHHVDAAPMRDHRGQHLIARARVGHVGGQHLDLGAGRLERADGPDAAGDGVVRAALLEGAIPVGAIRQRCPTEQDESASNAAGGQARARGRR